MKISVIMIAFITLAALPNCSGRKDVKKIVITGSSTVAPLIQDLAKAYERIRPDVQIDVQTGGSSRGIRDVRQGRANLGMVSRALKPAEADLRAYTIARDGLAIILHKSNPVQDLSEEQIRKIYTGKITNWKELDGRDADVTVVHKAEGRSTLELFLTFFKLENPRVKPHVVIGDNEQGVKTVAGNANAVGYVSIGTAEANASRGVPIKLLPYKGVSAEIKSVARGVYPLARLLNLVGKGELTPTTRDFVKFVRSVQAHGAIRRHYFVPLNAGTAMKKEIEKKPEVNL